MLTSTKIKFIYFQDSQCAIESSKRSHGPFTDLDVNFPISDPITHSSIVATTSISSNSE